MDVSIIILNYRSRGLVKQCVKTIRLYPTDCSYEIIVVDNDSGDGVKEVLAENFPEVKFVASPKNIGYAGGNNLGIEEARGRYVLIMNPDITVRPGSIDGMVRFMDRNADVGVMGPKLLHPDGSVDHSCYRFPKWITPIFRRTPFGRLPVGKKEVGRYVMSDYDHENTRDVDWLLGAVLMVRKSAMDSVGTLDDRYFLYFEDTDWCRRFWDAGYRIVYYTGTTMVHYHARLSAQVPWMLGPLSRSTRTHIVSCVKYFRKWGVK
ncbi:MAG: glycosyltransferase family 2 protein [Patescibacteria group bacterium]|nr:glycosyltransferase family 2 protein [Patescibacteria group bacterium]